MALRSLTSEEMVRVSTQWLTPGAARQALLSNPTTAGAMPHVDVAHRQLVGQVTSKPPPRCQELGLLAQERDGVQERLLGVLHGLLTELAPLVDHGEELLHLRSVLAPDGLGALMHATSEGKAGHAAELGQRLTPELQGRLAAVPVPGGTLLERLFAWLDASERLGTQEQDADEVTASQVSEIRAARQAWARAVAALRAMAALAPWDAERDRLIFGALDSAESRADVRVARDTAAAVACGVDLQRRVSEVVPASGTTPLDGRRETGWR